MDSPEIKEAFTYHAPNDDQLPRYQEIRNTGRQFAEYLIKACPPSRELSIAITKLREAVMWANASIAVNE